MGTLEEIGNAIAGGITKSIQRLAAVLFLLFAAGVGYGSLITQQNPGMLPVAIGAPVVLAVIAYFNTAFAAIVFVLLAVVLIIL